MSKKANGVNYSKSVAAKYRRTSALKRLQKQLILNKKNVDGVLVELTPKDVKRIAKEVETLKERI